MTAPYADPVPAQMADAGVVDDRIEATVVGHDSIHAGEHGVGVGDVEGPDVDLHAGLLGGRTESLRAGRIAHGGHRRPAGRGRCRGSRQESWSWREAHRGRDGGPCPAVGAGVCHHREVRDLVTFAAEMLVLSVATVLLGAGGWVAGGCNLGHGLSGMAQLNVSSCVVVAAVVAGIAIAARVKAACRDRP